MNRKTLLQIIAAFLLTTTWIALPSSAGVLLSDNFDDNSINSSVWTNWGTSVFETGQLMQVLQNATDAGGNLRSRPIPINADGQITLTRNVRLHYSMNYFIARTYLHFAGLPRVRISYGNMSYNGVPHRAVNGFFISRNDEDPHNLYYNTNNVSPRIAPLWDTWFKETISYSPQSGSLVYSINDVPQTTFNVGVMPPTNAPMLTLQFDSWGWWTGYQHFFDDLVVTQTGAIQTPYVITQPANQSVNAGSPVQFIVLAGGGDTLSYQWRFNGQNITDATNAIFTVTNTRASDSGGYSVRVANVAGSVVSATAHLAVLADGANNTPPEQATTRPVPPREPNQNNLVLITHGYQAFGQHATWVDEMANTIETRLTSEGKANWQVVPIHWNEAAWGLPVMALSGARIVGALYGAEFAQTQWQHIHLIAHSAGSVFIEAFAKEIKAVWPATVIHCTYLDPYLSIVWGLGRETYGQNADWSDSYFAADETATLTRGKLVNAHNVEVTGLDPDARYMPLGGSLSSHGWPYRFYAQTVSGAVPGAGQYGYLRSKEAEGWDQRGDYPMNNSPVILPASATPSPFQGETPFNGGAAFAFDVIPLNTSGAGASLIGSFSFSLSTTPILPIPEATRSLSPSAEPLFGTTGTTEPAWLAIGATVTTEVNFVQFDAEFTSASAAEGLLTIFWNTNQIGMIDERTSTAGLQTHRFELPSLMAEGVYTLSFRLDSYGTAESSLVITNVTTGLSGIVDPIVLGWASSANNAWPTLEVTAPTGFTYLVQTSTNLIEWTPQGFHLHTNAVMQFVDPDSTNSRQRFYKALLP